MTEFSFIRKKGFKKLYSGVEWKALKLLLQAYRNLGKLDRQDYYRLQGKLRIFIGKFIILQVDESN